MPPLHRSQVAVVTQLEDGRVEGRGVPCMPLPDLRQPRLFKVCEVEGRVVCLCSLCLVCCQPRFLQSGYCMHPSSYLYRSKVDRARGVTAASPATTFSPRAKVCSPSPPFATLPYDSLLDTSTSAQLHCVASCIGPCLLGPLL